MWPRQLMCWLLSFRFSILNFRCGLDIDSSLQRQRMWVLESARTTFRSTGSVLAVWCPFITIWFNLVQPNRCLLKAGSTTRPCTGPWQDPASGLECLLKA